MTVYPTWTVEVDAGENEFSSGSTTITAQLIEGTIDAGMESEWQRLAEPSKAVLTFDDTDRYFSPENVAALGIVKGRFLRVRATYNAITYTLYTGEIQTVKSSERPYKAVIECAGALIHAQARYEVPLYQSIRSDEAILPTTLLPIWREYLNDKFILDEVGHAELDSNTVLATHQPRSIFEGETNFTYFGLQYDSPTLAQVYRDIAEAEWGFIYDNPITGELTFATRHVMLQQSTASFSITEDSIDQVDYKTGDNIINQIYMDLEFNTLESGIVLWQSIAPIRFKTGDSMRIIRFLQEDGRLLAVESDFSSWGFVFKDQANGGNVVTPNYLLEPLTTGARITVHNTSSSPCFLQIGARITGNALLAETPVRQEVIDYRSRSFYGAFPLELRLPPFADADSSDYLAEFLLYSRAEPQSEVLSFRLRNFSATNLVKQLDVEIGQLIQMDLTALDHSNKYNVIGYQHKISQGGIVVKTSVRLIKQYAFWLLGVDGYGRLDQTCYLGY